jgi:hypothetical protein
MRKKLSYTILRYPSLFLERLRKIRAILSKVRRFPDPYSNPEQPRNEAGALIATHLSRLVLGPFRSTPTAVPVGQGAGRTSKAVKRKVPKLVTGSQTPAVQPFARHFVVAVPLPYSPSKSLSLEATNSLHDNRVNF